MKHEYKDMDQIVDILLNKSFIPKDTYKNKLNQFKEAFSQINTQTWDNREQRKLIIKFNEEIIGQVNDIICAIRKDTEYLLRSSLSSLPRLNWGNVIKRLQKNNPKPIKPKYPCLPPQPKLSWYEIILPYLKRKKLEKWKKECNIIKERIETLKNRYQKELAKWNQKRQKIIEEVLAIKSNFKSGKTWAIEKYFGFVIEESPYPWDFKKEFDLKYNKRSRILVLDFNLPIPEKIPNIKEIKYIKNKNKIKVIYLSERELAKFYDKLIYQVALKTIYELFVADTEDYIDSIVFNGIVKTIDKRTGQPINPCIMTIHAKKQDFLEINLSLVDPKECFRHFKGIGSSKLHLLTPVAPIMQITKEDERFIEGYHVIDNIHEGFNLASMDWLDFENLIRELFEKEFSSVNGEVKITRASRDRGVDAIAFDPDPIRGGKIVLQAKRYTNNVDVSSVRDLYGTIVNEGATKGILITTSDFGPDAYEFAKDKPITLINGAGLLYLLKKHGYKAYIDLKEARKTSKKSGTD